MKVRAQRRTERRSEGARETRTDTDTRERERNHIQSSKSSKVAQVKSSYMHIAYGIYGIFSATLALSTYLTPFILFLNSCASLVSANTSLLILLRLMTDPDHYEDRNESMAKVSATRIYIQFCVAVVVVVVIWWWSMCGTCEGSKAPSHFTLPLSFFFL